MWKYFLLSSWMLTVAAMAQDSSVTPNVVHRPSSTIAVADLAQEKRIESILSKMTLEEKVRMCFGGTQTGVAQTVGVPRLGIPGMRLTDGPRGVTAAHGTAFPSGIGLGATWDPHMMEEVGRVIGQEARYAGITGIFAPAINIERDPLGGRFFEYMTEDPYLDGELAVGMVKGIQGQRVVSIVKHFVANNREENRDWYMSNVDERTLREIYFPAFKAAVEKGGAWGVMTAANGINGKLAATNGFLIHDVLEGEWGFQGVVMTDFNQARDTVAAANAGLDIGMPWGEWATTPFGKPLMEAVEKGEVSQAVLDDKVRRILRVMDHVGLLDGLDPHAGGSSIDTPEHHAIARMAAEESIVLLKNEHHVLPLNEASLKHVIVLGPNATKRQCIALMGGSSGVQAPYEITPLEGIRKRLEGRATVEYVDIQSADSFEPVDQQFWAPVDGQKGIHARYYNDGTENPVLERVEPKIDFTWEMRSPDPKIVNTDNFHAAYDGTLVPPQTGTYTFRLRGEDTARFAIDGLPLIENRERGNVQSQTGTIYLEAGRHYQITLYYHAYEGDASLHLEWLTPSQAAKEPSSLPGLKRKLQQADAVIFVGGWSHGFDSEGQDRVDMNFPAAQAQTIETIEAWNPKTVVVLIHGSPFTMPWLSSAPTVLDAWYPGMEGGTAIAEALMGDINPAGKLAFTWPKRLEDAPSRAIGTQDHNNVNYKEGVFLGYRYYDTKGVVPEFPFGYGLSYSTFKYEKLSVASHHGDIQISLRVKNASSVPGTEIAQVYVTSPKSAVPRPVHELKAFARVSLQAGETREVTMIIHPSDLGYWDVSRNGWTVVPGDYIFAAGASSRDIRQVRHFEMGRVNAPAHRASSGAVSRSPAQGAPAFRPGA